MAMSPHQQMNDLIVISDNLAELLERENEALRNLRPDTVAEMLDEKNKLTKAYEIRVRGLAKERQEALRKVDDAIRDRLREVGTRTHRLMEQNARLLKTSIDANRRVVRTIAEAARKSKPSAGTYGANGSVTGVDRRTQAEAVPVSINKEL
ncbi:MAG: flagellar export chaperone FlgN [Magnetovibrionaceae bacterium]